MSHHPRPLSLLTAMKIGARTPAWLWRPIGGVILTALVANPPRHMRQWQLNYQVVTGRPASKKITREAFDSWLENLMTSLQLGTWSSRRILSHIVMDTPDNWDTVMQLNAQGGIIIALPHMGSWDLAGAYAGLRGIPVSSVAEALPDGQFEYFRELRESLGIRIYSVRERDVYGKLREDAAAGRAVCLVADRDFSRRALPVRWTVAGGTREQRMPPGPVLLSQRGPHPLFGAATWFDRHHKLHIAITSPITVGDGEEGLIGASQRLADFFAEQVRAHPLDWHMLQRFFGGVTA